jgi:hypothetical protein
MNLLPVLSGVCVARCLSFLCSVFLQCCLVSLSSFDICIVCLYIARLILLYIISHFWFLSLHTFYTLIAIQERFEDIRPKERTQQEKR